MAPLHPQDILYDQFSSPGNTGATSQQFEPALAIFDSQSADDFTVPSGETWLLTEVEAGGAYANGPGPAVSVNVAIYQSDNSLPGPAVYTATDTVYTTGQAPGDLVVTLPNPVSLEAGTYWLSVQAHQDLETHGQWYWTGRNGSSGARMAWRNPGDGFLSGCRNWTTATGCNFLYAYYLGDNIFRLRGTVGLSTPTVTGTPPTATNTPLPTNTVTPPPTPPTATATPTPGLPLPIATQPVGVIPPTAIPTCGIAWRMDSPPSVELHNNQLDGIAAVSATEMWAVGATSADGVNERTLIEHWNGTTWSQVPSPNPWSISNHLTDVAVVAPNDAWAVGYGMEITGRQIVILHWNGTAWTTVPTPAVAVAAPVLYGITALSANDVWAVGGYNPGADEQTLILHWNGTAWAVVPSPNTGNYANALFGIDAASPTDIWASGWGDGSLLMLHWNGTAWNISPTAFGCGTGFAISARTTNDVWVVGNISPISGSCYPQQAAGFHWDGTGWQNASGGMILQDSTLRGVVALGPADVWAVGGYRDNIGRNHTLVEHWNGTIWSRVASPDNPAADSGLSGLAVAADLWSVGTVASRNTRLLAERYSDPCGVPNATPTATFTLVPTATVTNSPTATNSPTVTNSPTATASPTATVTVTATATATSPASATATVTATRPPATATSTATVCPVQFSDVTDPTAYYYQPVYYLACHGVITGYADGTFRPFNNTTRGQMSKIIVLAYNLPLATPAAGGFTFADTPPNSTFFAYIETAAARGIVGGYPCGGLNPQNGQTEPCDSNSRPYYRPGNNVTRGQLTKIAVGTAQQAQGWALLNPVTPSFSDVPAGSTFYQYIETAVCHGVLGGYADGTFRPANPATRGQISKIVYNAVSNLPGCGP
jgi:hypothetical protein